MFRSSFFILCVLTFLAPLQAMRSAVDQIEQASERVGCAAFLAHRCPKGILCPRAVAAARMGDVGTLARHTSPDMVNMASPDDQKTLADHAIESQADAKQRIRVLVWLIKHGLLLDFSETSPLVAAIRLGDIAIFQCLLNYAQLHIGIIDCLQTSAESGLIDDDFYSQALVALQQKCVHIVRNSSEYNVSLANEISERIYRLRLNRHVSMATNFYSRDLGHEQSLSDVATWAAEQGRRTSLHDFDPMPSLSGTADNI